MFRSLLPAALALVALFAPVAPAAARAQETRAAAPAQVVNVNTATAAQFEALPGIGPSMAQRIVSYREKNGPFKKLEDLMNVQGIGEKSFLKLRPYLSVGAPAEARASKD
uniref:ComEA family DNA-binding protein n=1 Tax=Luteitalea sp. TBR-22 TaxID=2802971 RepID=UPI001AF82BF0|nr:helix-hairpin-helix domain-containing protein [Luteitalea sp. TBR-22]BCS33309.1 hypothetical protein TBR22_A25360 [Luteitalea sp. TBR-22]